MPSRPSRLRARPTLTTTAAGTCMATPRLVLGRLQSTLAGGSADNAPRRAHARLGCYPHSADQGGAGERRGHVCFSKREPAARRGARAGPQRSRARQGGDVGARGGPHQRGGTSGARGGVVPGLGRQLIPGSRRGVPTTVVGEWWQQARRAAGRVRVCRGVCGDGPAVQERWGRNGRAPQPSAGRTKREGRSE